MLLNPQFHPDRVPQRIHTYIFSCDATSWNEAMREDFTNFSFALLKMIVDELKTFTNADFTHVGQDGFVLWRQLWVSFVPINQIDAYIAQHGGFKL